MAVKKSELYSSLWKSCDELRGGMDASQYKDYVLVLLFVKYISDKAATRKDYLLTVPKGGSFADMVAAKGDKEIGDRINKIVSKLADANESLKGAINVADFNDEDRLGKGQAMVERLSKLVAIFESLEFGRNSAEGDDLLGDAYEYLMRHFATESGKSKGQFYTPAEVSRVMAKVLDLGSAAKRQTPSIYDPTCGSGSLLLKVHDEAQGLTGLDLALYGQEMDNATAALARMNMVLHDCPTAEIWQDNTLAEPHFKQGKSLKTFDYAVANPPFSFKAWASGVDVANDPYGRFEYGTPPAKNGDYAFLLHILASLKSTGKGAVILPHGVLFRGGAEGDIRTRLIRQGFIKGLIGLPANLFYGTGIPACIVVLDKEHAHARKGIFMVDASKGYIKDGNKNRLRAQDIHKIVDIFNRQVELPRYSKMISLAEIETNGYNLNLPRYIDSSEPEDLQDIEAHLKGGIPVRDVDNLAPYWQVLPQLRAALFSPQANGTDPAAAVGWISAAHPPVAAAPGSGGCAALIHPTHGGVEEPSPRYSARPHYCYPRVAASEVKATIFAHPEFTAFNQQITALFEAWKQANHASLTGIRKGDRPKALIEALSENLLAAFRTAPLLDAYDVYQHLMDYWEEAMQDDVYLLVSEGWRAVLDGKPNTDLIPTALIIARYFADEHAAIEKLQAQADTLTRALEELDEEHSGEDGLLADARTDKNKLTVKSVKERLKAIKRTKDTADEHKLLEQVLELMERETIAHVKVKTAEKALFAKVIATYPRLTEAEIKTLIVDDKWLARLAADVQSELDRVSQALTGRIRQLAERYARPLPKLIGDLETQAERVDDDLRRMGFAWN